MAKGRWERYTKVNPFLLEIIRNNKKPMTTNEIREKLRKNKHIPLHHRTVKIYLDELKKAGHIDNIEMPADKNKVVLWTQK